MAENPRYSKELNRALGAAAPTPVEPENKRPFELSDMSISALSSVVKGLAAELIPPGSAAPAQPVEGPRETKCRLCGKPIAFSQALGGGGWYHIGYIPRHMAAPVEGVERVTDDRPAETIPDDEVCGGHCGACDEKHRDWEGSASRAETRIEVLEAALRDAVKILSKKVPGMYVESRKIAIARLDAALAAPSGEKEKV